MAAFFFTAGMGLIVLGSILSFTCAIFVVVRAFRTSLLWGLATLLLPVASLIYLIRFWSEQRRLFLAQLTGALFVIMGVGMLLTRPEARLALQRSYGRFLEGDAWEELSPKSARRAPPDRAEALAEERRSRVRQLYGLLCNWQAELKQSQPGPGAPPAEAEAFRREYANYQALLEEYKAAAAALPAAPPPAPAK